MLETDRPWVVGGHAFGALIRRNRCYGPITCVTETSAATVSLRATPGRGRQNPQPANASFSSASCSSSAIAARPAIVAIGPCRKRESTRPASSNRRDGVDAAH